jgi:hypothetical protein
MTELPDLTAVSVLRILIHWIRIQHFGWIPIRVLWQKFTAEKKIIFSWSKIAIHWSSKLQEKPSTLKEIIQHFKTWNLLFSIFVGNICPPYWIRIRIRNTEQDRRLWCFNLFRNLKRTLKTDQDLVISVVDPHHLDADANPDSTYHPDADPDFFMKRIRIRLNTLMRIRIQILASK